MLTSAQVADKWAKNTTGATEDYKNGVKGVTESPTAKAAQQQDRMLAGVQQAIASGRYRDACNAVSTTDWINACVNKGAGRISQGVASAKPSMQAFMNDWLPVMSQVSGQVKSMPKGSTEDALARVRVNIEAGKRFAGKL